MFDPHIIDYIFVLAESKMDRKDKLFVINEVRKVVDCLLGDNCSNFQLGRYIVGSGSKPFSNLMVFLKEFFEKVKRAKGGFCNKNISIS